MNIILFEKDELKDGHVFLRDHRAKHIVKILHGNVGDSVRVGMIDGHVGTGKILRLESKYPFLVDLLVNVTEKPVSVPAIDLLLAMPRPIMLKRILSQVTALGVGKILIINANRVEKSFWEAGILDPVEYRPHLIQGLEQAVDTRLPEILISRSFKDFAEQKLPAMTEKYSHLLLAHPNAKQSLSACMAMHKKVGRVLYAIGPEGGWVDFELEKFTRSGMHCFSVGARILKVDTAVVAIHSRISQALE
jgi:RsmE family RNA methyltransferase